MNKVGFPTSSYTAASVQGLISELQSFANVQASSFARHSDRSHYTTQMAYSSSDFYIRSYHSLLPPCAPDMLAVRTGQLTAGDFHPIKPTALSADPHMSSVDPDFDDFCPMSRADSDFRFRYLFPFGTPHHLYACLCHFANSRFNSGKTSIHWRGYVVASTRTG